MIILKENSKRNRKYLGIDLNSNMIILKVPQKVQWKVGFQHLNSNMIILKEKIRLLLEFNLHRFKFQYDNT